MHILLLTHHYEPEIGAPQRRWSALVERWTSSGHQVTVYCPSPHYPDVASTDVLRSASNRPFTAEKGRFGERIVRQPYVLHEYSTLCRLTDQMVTAVSSITSAVGRHFLPRLIGRCTFDVVISTVPGLPSLFAGIVIAKFLGIPHIAEMRDAWPDVVTGRLNSHVKRISLPKLAVKRLVHEVVTRAQRSADAVVATTPFFARELASRGVRHVEVMANGAEAEDFSVIEALKPGFQDERRAPELRVQYLGTVGRSQGLMVLVKALELVQKRRPELNIRTRVIGGGAESEFLKAESERRGAGIEFFRPISRDQLVEAYSWADVEIVSLRKTQPFKWTIPSKLFELLATHRYVVGLLEGDAAEILNRSDAGSVIEPGDHFALADELERLAENPDQLVLDDSGVDLLKREFDYSNLAANYEKLIESVVAERTRFGQVVYAN